MALEDTPIEDNMPIDQKKKRYSKPYRYNIIKDYKLKKIMETGYFNDYTEILDEGVEFVYSIFVLKKLPPDYELIVKSGESEKEPEKK
jgi:hypothetical protein